MASHNISKYSRGFTLLEVLLVLGIISSIFGLGLFFTFDFYGNYSLALEKEAIVSILKKARSRSLYNIGQAPHGVRFQADTLLAYSLFECQLESCSQREDENIIGILQSSLVSPSPTLPFNIVFEQLSGNCSSCQDAVTIRISNQKRFYDITINREGQIDG